MTSTAPLTPAVTARTPARVRPPLVRPTEGRVAGGVAVGLAAHLGISLTLVRVGLVLLAVLGGGAGILLYVWLWALVPTSEHVPTVADAVDPATGREPLPRNASPASVAGPSGPPGSPGRRPARPRVSQARLGDILLGGLLLFAGLSIAGARFGWDVNAGLVVPVVVVLGGAVLAYSQLDEVERSRWAERSGVQTRAAVLRIVGGLVLVLVGVLLVVVRGGDPAYAGRVLVAVLTVLGGAGLVLAPWALRLWRDLDTERSARVREAERADIAAHLHDSVLQTLALIQRSAADPAQVARLARAQERDLRDWLYGARPEDAATMLAAAVRQVTADVEDRFGVAVEVVVVGDRRLDERTAVLVAALREACVNAVRHAGAPVTVYVESGPDGVEAFVRDRGPGFDPDAVPADRLGVRESIVGRMQRHRGSATIRSLTGDGTEVRLDMPDERPDADRSDADRPEPGSTAAADPAVPQTQEAPR
jgi:signal transduction histidine kinase/phage shock protein PspC (stress-responsive transcriptional regulator)